MRSLLLLLVPGIALADPPEFKPYRDPRRVDTTVADAEQGFAKLTAAIRARDARAIQRQLAKTVQFEGSWFADTACRKRFGRSEELKTTANQAALAKCLAGVKLQVSTRRAATEDGAVLTIDPGIEVEILFDGARVRWLSFAGKRAGDALLPTLTAQAFEALRTAGTTKLDAVLKKPLEGPLKHNASVSAWMRICLDATGLVTSATVRESEPEIEVVKSAFAAAVGDWKFKPFTPGGVATPACSLSLLTYPAAKAPDVETLPGPPAGRIVVRDPDGEEDGDEYGVEGGMPDGTPGGPPAPPLPPPPPPPRGAPAPVNVAPSLLEALRIAGTRNILPDEATKREIKQSGKDAVVGVWKLCLDTNGAVMSLTTLKSTGFARYDQAINTEMRKWKYRPYTINGKVTPVCTAITFIYRK